MSSPIVQDAQMTDFTFDNIPFGVFSCESDKCPRVCSAIGKYIIDLRQAAQLGVFDDSIMKPFARDVFSRNTLNSFMILGREFWRAARKDIQQLLTREESVFQELLIGMDDANMHLPFQIGDYTDFYSSKEHATNVGIMFRGKDNALQPNWLHLPVGYHGRSSSVIPSGTPITRPRGQLKPKDGGPVVGLCQKLDFELEMAFVVGVGNELGESITAAEAEKHIFGVVLMNDWSARDIQAWEYVPLGPFLGKNFGTVISPWVITMDALEPFRCERPVQDPIPPDYLVSDGDLAFDVDLTVSIKPKGSTEETTVCTSNLKYLYWTFRQQLAHHTINGCNMRPGDLCGTGTISGPEESSYGSMLELSWNGEKSIELEGGGSRKFIEDGDTVIIRGSCSKGNKRLGFGECICPVN